MISCHSSADYVIDTSVSKDLEISGKLGSPIDSFDEAFEFKDFLAISIPDSIGLVEISKIEPYEESYLIYDERKENVFLVDEKGSFIRKFGRIGGGPGEYTDLEDFVVVKDEVFLMTRRTKNLLVFQISTGEFKRQIDLGLYADQIVKIENDEFLVYVNHSENNGNHNIKRFDKEGKELDGYFPFDPSKQQVIIPFSGGLMASNERVLFMKPFDEYIFEYDPIKKSFYSRFRTDLLSDFILENKGDFKVLASPEVMVKSFGGQSWNGSIFFENDKKILFNFFRASTLKNGIFDKGNQELIVFAKSSANPLFKILDTAKYLEGDIVYFPIYGEKMFDESFFSYSKESKFKFDLLEAREKVRPGQPYYLLKAKLK